MAYRKIAQAMSRGRKWAEEQLRTGGDITPEMLEQAASEAFHHRGQQYVFTTSAMEVLLEKDKALAKSA